MGGVSNTLFHWEGEGLERLGEIQAFLAPDARVRFLGCLVGTGDPGRTLLLKVRDALGCSRMAYGSFMFVDLENFVDGMFDPDFDEFLFSSTEAQSGVAPTFQERLNQIAHKTAMWTDARKLRVSRLSQRRIEDQ